MAGTVPPGCRPAGPGDPNGGDPGPVREPSGPRPRAGPSAGRLLRRPGRRRVARLGAIAAIAAGAAAAACAERATIRQGPHDDPADNHASDQHHGPIDRVHVYPYRSSQDRIEAVPRIRMNRDAAQARCLEINATASERSYRVTATNGNGKRERAEGRARSYNRSGAWGIC